MPRPGYLNERRRELWASFRPESGVYPPETTGLTSSPGEVLRRLRLLQADFEFSPSQREAEAVEWCRQALVESDQAAGLWTRLLEIVSTVRTADGTLTHARLAERLDGLGLAVLPRYEADHRILTDVSAGNLDGVVESLAGGVNIRRNHPLAAITEAAAGDRFLALVGPSGVGKTASSTATPCKPPRPRNSPAHPMRLRGNAPPGPTTLSATPSREWGSRVRDRCSIDPKGTDHRNGGR